MILNNSRMSWWRHLFLKRELEETGILPSCYGIGTKMAASFAKLFLGMFETNALTNAPWQPSIKFTSSNSLTNVPFPDIMVSLHNGIIETDIFTKPTDKHQHLILSSSGHPHHTKKSIPFSLALRLHRICSTDAKFKHRINELKTYLLARGYNNNS